ncbi:TPA: hypothetical protein QHU17_003316 [Enterobacter hormaechei subsp. xiangfangensis]|nr:hypothetical protein [Enterobacter hormaechei subsp. xiangfangensis]
MPNCKNKVAVYLSDDEIEIIESYKNKYQKENGIPLSRNAIIKMLISRLSKEISIYNNNTINTI